uniref:Uncharacterized protein n=1 Tax=Meloidogyne enterolobii TaxID=390850 RepID=A0A6V7VGE5_MELEN|nr:unnamed protein product [Meloidogyne enterolobii]
MFDYYKHQLELFAQLCQDQQYLAIDPPPERKLLNISQQLPVDLVIKCISDSRLPFDIRASFCRLMLHLHVVRGSPVPAVRHARLWRDIPEKVFIKKYHSSALESYKNENTSMDSNGGHMPVIEFHQEILETVQNYLLELCNLNNGHQPILVDLPEYADQNRLTYEVINLAKALAQFGFYDFEQMLELTQYLLIIVDSCPSQKENNNLINNNSKIKTHTKLIRQISKFTSITTTKNDEEIMKLLN